VYSNGKFSGGKPEDDNHVFLVEPITELRAIALKAVNHNNNIVEEGSGSGSGQLEEEDEVVVIDDDCYLGFTQEGHPMCFPTKDLDNAHFASNCYQ
jgi:hypothetical protein